MEDATITQEAPQELYAQGKYPTIIDTDDLVFELGKQLIGNLNKEKLLDNLLQKGKLLEQLAIEAKKESLAAKERKLALEKSNASYIQNNKKLDSELVKLRLEASTTRQKYLEQIDALTKQLTELEVHITDLSQKLELAVIENEKLRKPAPKPRTRRKTVVKKLVDKE